jgi:hypothetical protein
LKQEIPRIQFFNTYINDISTIFMTLMYPGRVYADNKDISIRSGSLDI